MIQENLDSVRENIRQACLRSGREEKDVTLICVSKTKPVADILTAYECGERNFGENKVQEMTDKYQELPKDIRWHFIGHLQRNKVKYIIDKAHLIHSVDSFRLAEQIEAEGAKHDVLANILIQVNISREETKFGLDTTEVIDMIKAISDGLPHIRIKGLMTIAPYTEEPEENRIYFRQLRELSEEIAGLNLNHVEMRELSMGMTGDYMTAIEEGATLVRVGTGIFGNRIYLNQQ